MVSRRAFCQVAGGAILANTGLFSQVREAIARNTTEWSFSSGKSYRDPFNEVELDVVFEGPGGVQHRVPAFWAGGQNWRVRYAAAAPGEYTFHSVCSDAANADLHGKRGTLHVSPYEGKNPQYQHGPVRVAADRRHFEHADGTPFFWLGDTQWMGLCDRIKWPDEFQSLTADRLRKGFTVVQIVAGLYPDMPAFDPRGENEAGFPWDKEYTHINPGYFDMADLRIQYLADRGLVPCIVGCWGYFLKQMGVPKIKQHWRNIVARWGSYPVLWCLAGEGTMPFYLSKTPDQDREIQKHGWTELARYVRSIDPWAHPITIHPSSSARVTVDDASVLDFDMLQTGHDDRRSVPNTIKSIQHSLESEPKMPVLVGEVCYEGIQEASREEVQRFMFWSCILSGAGGHTYGANGIWQVNTREKPYGLSPHGHAWGGPPWDVAAQLPGSTDLGLGKKLLMRYSWWKLEPAPDMVQPHWTAENYWQPFAARIPGEAVIVFSPTAWKALQFSKLEAGTYRAFLYNPSDGAEVDFGLFSPDASGAWKAPEFPVIRDWVMVLDRRG
ncbi:MAG TPA: DUF4038 domain-containing protein [Bryobacteraceae bacterium]|nr:DUF4038 domain-containing protein [Bryobacteraceae bacterium]